MKVDKIFMDRLLGDTHMIYKTTDPEIAHSFNLICVALKNI